MYFKAQYTLNEDTAWESEDGRWTVFQTTPEMHSLAANVIFKQVYWTPVSTRNFIVSRPRSMCVSTLSLLIIIITPHG